MTRIEEARRRVTTVRYAIGIGAAVAFAAFAAAARVSHPATHAAQPAAAMQSEDDQDGGGFFGDDSSNIGPSGSAAPQVQSGAS
jgi:hypothetical protein